MAYQAVINTIYRDMAIYQNIHALLTAQKENLFSRNNAALVDIANQITEQLQQARQNRHQRSVSLGTLKLPNTQTGMTRFFEQLKPTLEQDVLIQLLSDWKQLTTMVVNCKSINRVNGQLLQLQKETADRVLSCLRNREKNGSVYARNGQTTKVNPPVLQVQA